jgi:surfeit locus 1 family protein
MKITSAPTRRQSSLPGPSQWPQAAAGDYTYRAVRAAGQYLNDRETLVQAVTRLGGGFWVLTPLRTADGYHVLVNRGFVPPERAIPLPGPRA